MTCFNVQASSASQNFMRTGNTGEHRKIPVQQNWENSEHWKHRNSGARIYAELAPEISTQ